MAHFTTIPLEIKLEVACQNKPTLRVSYASGLYTTEELCFRISCIWMVPNSINHIIYLPGEHCYNCGAVAFVSAPINQATRRRFSWAFHFSTPNIPFLLSAEMYFSWAGVCTALAALPSAAVSERTCDLPADFLWFGGFDWLIGCFYISMRWSGRIFFFAFDWSGKAFVSLLEDLLIRSIIDMTYRRYLPTAATLHWLWELAKNNRIANLAVGLYYDNGAVEQIK